jgi:hypothetical protein
MPENSATKFFLLYIVVGLLGGLMFGLILALFILPLIHNFLLTLFFTAIVFLFFIPGICIQLWKKNYGVIIRRVCFAVFLGIMFSAMFSLEEGSIPFDEVDRTIIYICLAAATTAFLFLLVLGEHFNDSKLYKEFEHFIGGLKHYGILPEEKAEEEE